MPARPQGTSQTSTAARTVRKPAGGEKTSSRNSSPRTQQKRPGDLTGVRKQQQEKEHSEELAAKQAEMALANAAQTARQLDVVIDYTDDENTTFNPQHEAYENADTPLAQAPSTAIDVTKLTTEIRVNSKIEDMTFGKQVLDPGDRDEGRDPVLGNLRYYNFEEGPRYEVPTALALHLDELGLPVALRGEWCLDRLASTGHRISSITLRGTRPRTSAPPRPLPGFRGSRGSTPRRIRLSATGTTAPPG